MWTLLDVMSERGLLWVLGLQIIFETLDDVPTWVLMIGELFCMVVLCLLILGTIGVSRGLLRGRPDAIFGVGMFPDSGTILSLACRVTELYWKGVMPDKQHKMKLSTNKIDVKKYK